MATNRNLSTYQFTHEAAGEISGIHAYVKGKKREGVVGQIYWDNASGEITSAVVHPEHQGRGLATEMHRRASKAKEGLHHAPEFKRTLEGKQWINSLGARFGQNSSRNSAASGYGYGAG